MIRIISMAEVFKSSTLSYRASCEDLFAKQIESQKDKIFFISFANINSVSRSFADEFLRQIRMSSKKIICLKQSEHIKKMFRTLQKLRVNKPHLQRTGSLNSITFL